MIGDLLLWLQQHIKHCTKPATAVLIPGLLVDVTRSRSDLIMENALLRQQLIVLHRQIKRPQFSHRNLYRLDGSSAWNCNVTDARRRSDLVKFRIVDVVVLFCFKSGRMT